MCLTDADPRGDRQPLPTPVVRSGAAVLLDKESVFSRQAEQGPAGAPGECPRSDWPRQSAARDSGLQGGPTARESDPVVRLVPLRVKHKDGIRQEVTARRVHDETRHDVCFLSKGF